MNKKVIKKNVIEKSQVKQINLGEVSLEIKGGFIGKTMAQNRSAAIKTMLCEETVTESSSVK